jgi:protein-disulfide isomerase
MTKSIEPPRLLFPGATRRQTLALFGAGAAALGIGIVPGSARSEDVLTEALVLRDRDIPVAGNPDGDVTIVEYYDYQCPIAESSTPNCGK